MGISEPLGETYQLHYPDPYPFGLPEEFPRNAYTAALSASFIAVSGQCRVYGITFTNTAAATQWYQVFDAAAVPADTAVPIISVDVAAGTAKGIYFGSTGRWFRVGVIVCNSSTQGTKTIGSADSLFDVQFTPQVI